MVPSSQPHRTQEQGKREKAKCGGVEGLNTFDGIKSLGSRAGIGGVILELASPGGVILVLAFIGRAVLGPAVHREKAKRGGVDGS
jgi:hypothetical protein